jgi:hypothetical protein
MATGGDVVAASWLFTVFAVLSVGGVAASYAAARGTDRARQSVNLTTCE